MSTAKLLTTIAIDWITRFMRMSPERLEHLLNLTGPYMKTRRCRSREPISMKERLVLTLRFLATGDSQQSQSFNFRIGRSTVCLIIREVCAAIWKALNDVYLKFPKTLEDFKKVAEEFQQEWGFPHCIGAVDGKHICIDCPKKAGSMYNNYKNFNSTVLMGICDAKYRFLFVSIGSYGRDNDASIFSQTDICKGVENGVFPIPPPSVINGYLLPYVFTGDDIFPLKMWLMKPYPGKGLTDKQAVYNYRLSRCRRTIENTFGILAARWRIFRRPIRADATTVDHIVQATVCLHNYLALTQNAHYIPKGFVDSEDGTGNLVSGEWRQIIHSDENSFQRLGRVGSNTYSFNAKSVRENFCEYFNSKEGSLPWQLNYVRYCGKICLP